MGMFYVAMCVLELVHCIVSFTAWTFVPAALSCSDNIHVSSAAGKVHLISCWVNLMAGDTFSMNSAAG